MLLPGLLCDRAIWDPQIEHFSAQREVVVADYGDADSLEVMAQRALQQAPERFALVGHSMGARVALEIMLLAPERVTRLALLDTGVHPVKAGEVEKRYALRDVGRSHGMEALVNQWLPPMVHPDRHNDKALMQPLVDMAIKPGVAGFERQIRALINRRDGLPVLKQIKCPVLIAVGEQDKWSPPEQHREILAHLHTRSTFAVFPNTGHMAPVESPAQVNLALDEWFKL